MDNSISWHVAKRPRRLSSLQISGQALPVRFGRRTPTRRAALPKIRRPRPLLIQGGRTPNAVKCVCTRTTPSADSLWAFGWAVLPATTVLKLLISEPWRSGLPGENALRPCATRSNRQQTVPNRHRRSAVTLPVCVAPSAWRCWVDKMVMTKALRTLFIAKICCPWRILVD